jgi:hypothetical protein
MNILLIIMTLLVCAGVIFLKPAEAPGALAFCALVSVPTIILLARTHQEKTFILRLFVIAVLVRIMLATIIFVGNYEEFFGGDANTYDIFGQSLAQSWHGDDYHTQKYASFVASGASAWGMLYLVAAVYEVIGPNMFAIQLINAAVGAITAVVVYYSAQTLFSNIRVSRLAHPVVVSGS